VHRKRLLLVLDNFEQLLDAVGVLTSILSEAPGVGIVTTSRERLNCQEEWVFTVSGLGFAPAHAALDEADAFPAARLFAERARQVDAAFSLHDNIEHVNEVCRRVEGLPLALELAATWVRVMRCEQIADEMRRGLDFLATSQQDVPDRHRSVRAAIDRSWSLLSDAERMVMARLSVFRGGFDREAAAHVAGTSLAVLASLIDKSLIKPTLTGRFELHELTRQYMAEMLSEFGEVEAVSQLHLEFFVSLAEQAEAKLYGPDQDAWFDRLEADYHNLAAAMDWALAAQRAEAGLRLGGAVAFFCELRMHFYDWANWLERLLALDGPVAPGVRAKALSAAGALAHYTGDDTRATERFNDGLRLARSVGDEWSTAWNLTNLGIFALPAEGSTELLEEALRLFRALGDGWGISHALRRLGWVYIRRGDLERAESLQRESLHLARQAQNSYAAAWSLLFLGDVVWLRTRSADYPLKLWQESRVLAREARDVICEAAVLLMFGQVAQVHGQYEQARLRYRDVVALEQEHGVDHQAGFAYPLVLALAQLAFATGKYDTSATLYGALPSEPETAILAAGFSTPGGLPAELEALRARLGDGRFELALADGGMMSVEEAIAYGLEDDVSRLRVLEADDTPDRSARRLSRIV
jgi:predicted ATPase